MERISEHISYKEATRSITAVRNGIKNVPNEKQLRNMKLIAQKVFEPLRDFIGAPIKVESFFRSRELNTKIGGSQNSQHMKGQAIDIDDDYARGRYTNTDMFNYIAENLEFDQIIWEFGNYHNPAWVHVSYKPQNNRKRISIAYRMNGYTQYKHFYKLYDFEHFKSQLY
jgi:hypothetical protein